MDSKVAAIFAILIIVYTVIDLYRCSRFTLDDSYRAERIEELEDAYTPAYFDNALKLLKYSGYALGIVGGLLLFYLLVFSRWKNIRVFISYNLENEAIVRELSEKLSDRPLKVQYLPRSSLDQDEIIQNVQVTTHALR